MVRQHLYTEWGLAWRVLSTPPPPPPPPPPKVHHPAIAFTDQWMHAAYNESTWMIQCPHGMIHIKIHSSQYNTYLDTCTIGYLLIFCNFLSTWQLFIWNSLFQIEYMEYIICYDDHNIMITYLESYFHNMIHILTAIPWYIATHGVSLHP